MVFAAYPIIPWIGVTAAGYGLGQVYGWSAERRQSFLLRLGAALTAGFVLLRLVERLRRSDDVQPAVDVAG